jgi:small-conductance mechanosensitive channel
MTGFDSPIRGRFWIVGMGALVILLLGTSAYSVPGLVRERRHTQDLTASNEALTASLRQMQNQLQLVSEKLNAIAAQPIAAQPAAIPPPAPRVQERPKVRAAASPRKATQAAEDARWRQMRTRLADQQKQIDTTRQETSQARKELQDNLDSTRDELSGAIAKTHDELAVLQKRGERNYYEFQIDKSKQFHAAGPLSLSLRKVNVKQGYYDVVLVVDDRHLEKKHANLYEPLMFTLADRPQPVDLVVNQISNNQVKGYVSEPKYKKTDLAAASPGTTSVTNDPKALQRR